MLRYVLVLCLLIMSSLAGCSSNAIHSSTKLIIDETVLYPENEPPSIKIKRGGDWKEISTVDDYPSKPEINSEQTKLAYIAPFEFEMAGEVWLHDAQMDESKRIFTQDQAGKEKSVKQIRWVDNDNLLILTGNTFGTVSSNRTLYLLDTHHDDLQQLFQVDNNQDIRELTISNGTTVSIVIVTYNEDSANDVSETKTIEITSFIN